VFLTVFGKSTSFEKYPVRITIGGVSKYTALFSPIGLQSQVPSALSYPHRQERFWQALMIIGSPLSSDPQLPSFVRLTS